MMTEAQIEVAARELCRLRGRDPDRRAGYINSPWPVIETGCCSPDGQPGTRQSTREWEAAAEELRAREHLDEALRVGREAKP